MRRSIGVLAAVFILSLGYGCATKEYVNSRVDPLDARVSKVEKDNAAGLDAALKKAQEAAARAEEASRKADEASKKAEDAVKRADAAQEKAAAAEQQAIAAEKNAEKAAKKSSKSFELMQKK
jgi:hypothetical protein